MDDTFKDAAANTGKGNLQISKETDPVSKNEKVELEKQRQEPALSLINTPDGAIVQEVHTQIVNAREARINHIEKRLQQARENKQLKRNFNRDKDR